MTVDLSVVIPAYNAETTIGATLEGLTGQRINGSWEVVVADNASTDRTAEIASEFADRLPNLRVVPAPRRGVSQARNQGGHSARGRSLVWLDADDVPAPGWLGGIERALSSHELIGSSHDNSTLNEQRVGGRGPDGLSQPMRLWYPPYVAHVGGCGLGVKRALWEQLGGFDESLRVLEDTDFCIRAQKAGAEVHLAADAWIQIRFRKGFRSSFHQARVWSAANVRLYKKYRTDGARVPRAWRDYGIQWLAVPRLIRRIRAPRRQRRLAWLLGWQIGMLQGCLRHRVPPIPYPMRRRPDPTDEATLSESSP